MRRGHFSLKDLPAWCILNNVAFIDVKVADISGRGYGFIAEKNLVDKEKDQNDDDVDFTTLLTVPRDLVLSAEGVEEYAKESKAFRELLNAAGHQSTRGDILLFLLFQLVLSSPDYNGGLGSSTPWTQYFSLLPAEVPIPTMWHEPELSYLEGTSLEPAVSAKLGTLTKEFDHLRDKLAGLSYWNELISIDETITVRDWILLDALYRSRSLDLPGLGESMVPCLDLVNHSSQATAHFQINSKGEVDLRLHKGCLVATGEEITINYGQDKPPAEMLFSYGFIDTASTTNSLVLPLEPLDDDPLSAAKLHAFGKVPKLRIKEDGNGMPQVSAPFVYLMCLNEEDGLAFRVLQEVDGSRHLKMFWQDDDITDSPDTIHTRLQHHELNKIFELRFITIIFDIIQGQLEKLSSSLAKPESARDRIWQAASHLRSLESTLFEKTLQVLDENRTQLLQEDTVIEYLRSMEADQTDIISAEAAENEEDFS